MAKKKKIKSIQWTFDEYTQHERSRGWYIWAIIIGLAILAYALLTSNWLFALIIVMIGMVIVLSHRQKPRPMDFEINHKGIKLGDRNYDYNELSKFWIIYQPPHVKQLYVDFKSPFRPRLSIPLEKENPIQIKSFLRNYLEEDLDQEQEPFSDSLGRILKM